LLPVRWAEILGERVEGAAGIFALHAGDSPQAIDDTTAATSVFSQHDGNGFHGPAHGFRARRTAQWRLDLTWTALQLDEAWISGSGASV